MYFMEETFYDHLKQVKYFIFKIKIKVNPIQNHSNSLILNLSSITLQRNL